MVPLQCSQKGTQRQQLLKWYKVQYGSYNKAWFKEDSGYMQNTTLKGTMGISNISRAEHLCFSNWIWFLLSALCNKGLKHPAAITPREKNRQKQTKWDYPGPVKQGRKSNTEHLCAGEWTWRSALTFLNTSVAFKAVWILDKKENNFQYILMTLTKIHPCPWDFSLANKANSFTL